MNRFSCHLSGQHTYVLAVGARTIENLILPHVEVEDHDQKDDAIIEPLSGDRYLGIFPTEDICGEAREVDVNGGSEMREVPILHDDQQIHDEDKGGQKSSR